MNKYSIFSLTTLVIFIVMYFTMYFTVLNGASLGALGRPFIFLMPLFPLLGILLGFKAKKGLLKWLLIILNIIAICIYVYIALLAYGIPER